MDDKLTAKTAKFTSLENLYVYGSSFVALVFHSLNRYCEKKWGSADLDTIVKLQPINSNKM